MPSSMSGANQPAFVGPMDPYSKYHKLPQDEKHCADHSHDLANAQPIHAHHSQSQSHCNDCSESDELHGHNKCHNSRLRRFLVPILASVLSLCLMLAVSCLSELDFFNGIGLGANGLTKRQSNGAGGSSSQDGPFVNNKLYLIVIFVGLLVVIVLAIMLSAWCCRGAFENPLCCPCYLCACCGGLACLECIGCGLCAEGVDNM